MTTLSKNVKIHNDRPLHYAADGLCTVFDTRYRTECLGKAIEAGIVNFAADHGTELDYLKKFKGVVPEARLIEIRNDLLHISCDHKSTVDISPKANAWLLQTAYTLRCSKTDLATVCCMIAVIKHIKPNTPIEKHFVDIISYFSRSIKILVHTIEFCRKLQGE